MPAGLDLVERIVDCNATVPDLSTPADLLASTQERVDGLPPWHGLEEASQVLVVPTLPQLDRAVGLLHSELRGLRAVEGPHPRLLDECEEPRIARACVAVLRC